MSVKLEDLVGKKAKVNPDVSKAIRMELAKIQNESVGKTYNIHFTREPRMLCKITADDQEALKQIHMFATAIEDVMEYNWRMKRMFPTRKEIKYTSLFSGEVNCQLGVGQMLYQLINSGADVIPGATAFATADDPTQFDNSLEDPAFNFSQKWLDIYQNHPKPEKGKIQMSAADAICHSKFGIIGLYTGAGKTELLIGTAESVLEAGLTEKVLIYTFANRVKEEIILRAEKYGVTIPWDLDVNSPINVINPAGLQRTNKYKKGEYAEFFKQVNCIIADEAHHFSAAGWQRLTELIDPDYIWGTTATGDSLEGVSLLVEGFKFGASSKGMAVLAYCGPSIIEHDLPVPVELTEILVEMSEDRSVIAKYQKERPEYMLGSLYLHMGSMMTAEAIKRTYNEVFGGKGITYIPMVQVEDGVQMAKNLNAIGIDTVFFSSSVVWTPVGEADGLGLDELKELAQDLAFKVLITTSVGTEGIDIPNLDSIIPLTGKSYKSVIQTIGRSARGDAVKVGLFFDKHNYMLNKQMKSKMETIKSRLKVISHAKVSFRK